MAHATNQEPRARLARLAARAAKGESGQAIAETTVSLIAIAAIFCGVLVVSDIARSSVENLIEARRQADAMAARAGGVLSPGGVCIKTWEPGGDGFLFTADDTPVPADAENTLTFRNELNIDEPEKPNHMSLARPPTPLTRNFTNFYGSSSLFLDAANLAGRGERAAVVPSNANAVTPDMFALIGGRPSYTIRDAVYMPGLLE